MIYRWQRYGGYEVSTRGDSRFSAFNAILNDGRSIEQHYQCDVKGYDPGGRNWRLGKGKPAINGKTKSDLQAAYLGLWIMWAAENPALIEELRQKATTGILSDRFATSEINQAWALASILNL